LAVKKFPLEKF